MRPSTFHYRRTVFTSGAITHEEVVAIPATDLSILQRGGGELGFLRLIADWNRVSLRGAWAKSPTLYVYTVEHP